MSRRNTYLLGGISAVAGIVMLIIAISALTSDDGDGSPQTDATERPLRPGSGSPSPPGGGDTGGRDAPSATRGEGAAIRRNLARRRPVRAPGFSAEVIHAGTIPAPSREAFERATARDALDLSELRGTPVVLHLWSSACGPCRGDARLVEATWKRWGPRGVLFVGASVKESAAAAGAVIRQYNLTYPGVLDRNGEIAQRYGATMLPQTFFISGDGDIVGEVAGSPSVRQLETGTAAAESGRVFGAERGGGGVPLR